VKPKFAVVFDLGNVLVDFDYRQVSRSLAQSSEAGEDAIHSLIHDSQLLIDFECGRIDEPEFFRRIQTKTGLRLTFDEFAKVFGDIFTENPITAGLPQKLRANGIPLCLLSNTNSLAVRFVRERFHFFGQFDHHVLSFEHGVMKPDAGLYKITETKLQLPAPQLLFFDDRSENVQAATQRGWQGIVFESGQQATSVLRDFGLLP